MLSNIEIGPLMSLADLEQCLAGLPHATSERGIAKLRIVGGPDTDLLTDIWMAILCGSVCRLADTEVIFSGGAESNGSNGRFASSLAGLTCVSTAGSLRSEDGVGLDITVLKRALMLANEGLVSPDSDVAQVLVEFDPDYPVSPLFQGADGAEVNSRLRRRLFQMLVLRFRQMLDIGALRRGGGPVNAGAAGEVGRFLAELHENGLEHGTRDVNGNTIPGTRFLRIRSHAAGHPTDLIERCGPFRQLSHYVERTFRGSDSATLVEASISDFGLGIVDAFQASTAGIGPDADRRELLENLIYGRLTSKSNDPAAGLGIQLALEAARRMQAFVSLRTAEFWMAASFLTDKPEARLVHLGPASHPPVAGTHWQIFWPQP